MVNKRQIFDFLVQQGIQPSRHLSSIILVGGWGKRLNKERKLITAQNFPYLNKQFYNQYGAKGMAILSLNDGKKTITDKHLQSHYNVKEIKDITLALGCQPKIFQDYYRNSKFNFIVEKNPAGTIAPLVKLWSEQRLSSLPLVYANGDNLINIDFYEAYLQGLVVAKKNNIDINHLVIDILAKVPYKESMNYGTVDYDYQTQVIKGFYEKSPLKKGKDLEQSVLINSGFSIICNPYALVAEYLNEEVITTSQALENQELNYSEYESMVKYETFYEQLALKGLMVGILAQSYWTDLGTEEKLIATENYFNREDKTRK